MIRFREVRFSWVKYKLRRRLILTNYIYDLFSQILYIYSLYHNHKIAHWRPRSTRKILDDDGRKERNWPTNLHITVAAVVALLLKRTQLLFRSFEANYLDRLGGWPTDRSRWNFPRESELNVSALLNGYYREKEIDRDKGSHSYVQNSHTTYRCRGRNNGEPLCSRP